MAAQPSLLASTVSWSLIKTLVVPSLSPDGAVTSRSPALPSAKPSPAPLHLPAMLSTGSDAGDIGVPSRSAIVGGTATGHHLLDIDGYSLVKELLPNGNGIYSSSFSFCKWGPSCRIRYFPNGDNGNAAEFISIYAEPYFGANAPMTARVKFSLLDQAGQPVPSHSQTTKFHNCNSAYTNRFGFVKFIKKAWLEESEHLKNDRFTIRCDVFVSKWLGTETRAAPPAFVKVPPSDMHVHFGYLLEAKKGADVVFQVAGETFRAHRCVLAARSAVFEAELFGPMKGSANMAVIPVDDMEAQVFGAFLHFVYTDTLPCGSSSKLEEAAMDQHLLVAADRYNLERLKLICEDRLCKHIDKDSVVTILLLAEQHHCHGLKKACFKFLSSPLNLNEAMATDDFDNLTRSCPSVLKELLSSIADRVPVDCE